jgi:cytochrome c oxidase subunit 2
MTPWGSSSSLDAAGPQAAQIAGLWWLFLGLSVVVYAAVMAALLLGLTRREGQPDVRRRTRVVGAAVGLTAFTLLALLVRSVLAGKALAALPRQGQLTVQVIARQWWWELQYQADPPSQMVITANELHIPVGQTVLLQLQSRDVIHSFWVPALHGKRDLIPGHPSTTAIRADRPGIYRGQCAEFCGVQHARMGLLVIAEPPEEFQRWLARSRRPAAEPATEMARRGREVFLQGPCVLCHTVSGTIAAATNGPNLTHVASQMSLAAGTVANVRGHLAGWIADSQGIKPGNHMPRLSLPPADLLAVVEYLESLK